ncbi:MAG: D-aminoacyl-tRNA deacylase [Treponema sp.]|jgi:D-tyrosyl-tRNA(Tyr) deacylase|nr:D-aminoacyl-tRNA deacylase [Treponema sp.]
MKAVIQRVIDASVSVNGELKGRVGRGLLAYLGVALDDTSADADWLAEKTVNLRIFNDEEGKMNLSLLELVNHQNSSVNKPDVSHVFSQGNNACVNRSSAVGKAPPLGVLAISQFTLMGDARKGRRPSWAKAAPPEKARELYEYFIEKIREKVPCESGEFQAHMEVSYTNDGPVTIVVDSRE